MTEPIVRVVACPTCRRSTRYEPQNEFRPFCSERCKNVDIVAWAEEGFKIPGRTVQQTEVGNQEENGDDED